MLSSWLARCSDKTQFRLRQASIATGILILLPALSPPAHAQTVGGSGGAGSAGNGGTGGSGGGNNQNGGSGGNGDATVLLNPGGGGGGGGGPNGFGGAGGNGAFGATGGTPGAGAGANGGNGADTTTANDGGGGGAGGNAGTVGLTVVLPGGVSNGAPLFGGAGGTGGAGGSASGNLGAIDGGGGGGGGAGGRALVVPATGATPMVNSSTITGAAGGAGGNGGNGNTISPLPAGADDYTLGGAGGMGGGGGAGTEFTGSGASLINNGTIAGGNGGAGGTGGTGKRSTDNTHGGNGADGAAGAGGVGVIGASLTIINSGTISGGLAGDLVTRANAITFTGGTNTLELRAGSTITGNVVAFSSADTLRLGGTTNSSFDASTLGPSAQYQGFGKFEKAGSGTWTLTGTNNFTGTTTVNGGTLLAGNAGAFSANSATTINNNGALNLGGFAQTIDTVNLNGGTLTNGSLTSAGGIASTGGIVNNIGGSTSLSVHGISTILTGTNTYTGATNIAAGGGAFGGNANAYSANSITTVSGSLHLGGVTQTINTVNLTGGGIGNGSLVSINGIVSTGGGVVDLGGSTSLTANGGITILANTNTYTGATTINSGGTAVGATANAFSTASATTINGGSKVDLGGFAQTINTVNLNGGTLTNGSLTSAGGIASAGGIVNNIGGSTSLSVNGPTTTLTGTNTYTGATNIIAGGVASGGNANAYSANSITTVSGSLSLGGIGVTQTINTVNLTGGGIGEGNLVSINGIVSTGGVVVDLGGSTSLTANGGLTILSNILASNTYTGATAVNGGTLRAGNANAFSAASAYTVAAGAFINLNNFSQTIASLAGAGNVNLGSATLTAGGDNSTTNFAGVMAGAGGYTKAGTGMMTLSGINAYGGATTVSAGALDVEGSIASSSLTTVNANAALTGTGAVGATQINANGIFAPGNGTPGSSMTVASLALASGAQYMVQINPATSSFANVTDTATLGGATVNATFANGTYVDKQYTILTAGHVSDTFGPTVNTNLPSGFHTSLSYDGSHAYLDLALNFVPPPGGGLTGNQQNVGNPIVNFFNSSGSIPIAFGGLTPAGLTQVSGETATGSQQTTFDAMNQFMGVMTDPFIAGRGDPVSAGGNPNAFAEEESLAYAARGKSRSKSERDAYAAVYSKAPPLAPNFEQRWSVWASGFGGSQRTDGNAVPGSNDTRSSLYGVAAGADYRLSPNTLAGFALAGGGTNFSVVNGGSGRSDLFQAGAFIRHNIGAAYLTAALAYGWQDITTDRTVTVAGVDRLHAEFNANAWSGRVEGGYRFVTQGFGWTPYAAGQFTTFDLPKYGETVLSGADTFALAYGAKSVTDTRSELGLRTDKSFAMQGAILTLRGRAAWAHDFNPDRAIGATFQTLPGASFVVNGAAQASDSALATASAEVRWINGWSTAATFEGEFSNVTRSYAGKGVVRYAW